MDQIILLTSCLSPVLKKDIANNKINNNLRDLNINIKNILKKFKFEILKYKIVIADCSQDFTLKIDDIYPFNNYLKELKILNIKFTEEEIEEIRKKGKGYSELLLMKYAISELNLKDTDIIHKITGRYCLVFPKTLIKYQAASMNNYNLKILCSKTFKKTSCHFFTIKASFLRKLINNLLPEVDDYKGNIIENVLFDFIERNKLISKGLVKRSLIFAYYSSRIKPGSSLARKGSSRYIYQIMRHLAFLF